MKALALAATLIAVLGPHIAEAADCNLTDRTSRTPLTAEEFFSTTPLGSLAIAEACTGRPYDCKSFFPISDCEFVNYRPPPRSFANQMFFVLNSAMNCRGEDLEGCDFRSLFLNASLVLKFTDGIAPQVDMTRNDSSDWLQADFTPLSRKTCCGPPNLTGDLVTKFFEIQGRPGAARIELSRATKWHWHSTFVSEGMLVSTWDKRSFFLDSRNAFSGCAKPDSLCSMKAYLLKFTETASGTPNTQLVFRARPGSHKLMVLRTSAPDSGGNYDWEVTIAIE